MVMDSLWEEKFHAANGKARACTFGGGGAGSSQRVHKFLTCSLKSSP
jgi:hypothetical protein